MEQIIEEEKILWPQNETVVTYNSVEEIEAAIRAGTAPRNLRFGNPDDEKDVAFWRRNWSFGLASPSAMANRAINGT